MRANQKTYRMSAVLMMEYLISSIRLMMPHMHDMARAARIQIYAMSKRADAEFNTSRLLGRKISASNSTRCRCCLSISTRRASFASWGRFTSFGTSSGEDCSKSRRRRVLHGYIGACVGFSETCKKRTVFLIPNHDVTNDLVLPFLVRGCRALRSREGTRW